MGALSLRDRTLLFAALGTLTLAGWLYLYRDAQTMNCAVWMVGGKLWNLPGFLLMFAMWAVMMVAMMVPSATPMVMTFAAVNRRRKERESPWVPTGAFLGGYLIVWTLFSALATVAQFWLQQMRLLSMELVSTSALFAGLLLIGAGVFQWTPWKRQCLAHCSGPLLFASGVMNLLWVAGLSAFVLAEKLAPAISRAGGLLMVAAGAWMILA